MNYLAHAYLSFNKPEILAGNMISDFVKGKMQFGYTESVQKGIQLHRAIDAFADSHSATAKAKEIFRPHYRLYSAPITDILYDHFLANDTSVFPEGTLQPFTLYVYDTLEQEATQLPPRFLQMLAYMKTENWLYNYRTKEGIEKSLRGMVRRASFINDSTMAYQLFLTHYQELQHCYNQFFPAVKQMAKEKLSQLLA